MPFPLQMHHISYKETFNMKDEIKFSEEQAEKINGRSSDLPIPNNNINEP